MRRVLVLTAVETEARAVARHLGLQPEPGAGFRWTNGALEVACVGLRAARLSSMVAARPPALVVSAGVCGALAPHLDTGALVVPEAVLADGARWVTAETGLPRAGTLLAVTKVVEDSAAKARLWMATGALAVDMESATILAWARAQGLPAAVVRGVADTAGGGVPADLAAAVAEDGRVRPLRALTAALARPRAVADALALRRSTAAALATVAAALGRLGHAPAGR